MHEDEWRPWYGRPLTLAIGGICVVTVVVVAGKEGIGEAARFAPWLALMTLTCWASFWRPRVTVTDAGVELVNVLRTVNIPWPAIQMIETKWALTLITAVGTFTAWAAPAPGVRAAVHAMPGRSQTGSQRAVHGDGRPRAETASGLGVRPGDLPSTPSGAAATKVRERWQQLRAQGHLDDPRLERPRAVVRWHSATILAALGLLALAVLANVTA